MASLWVTALTALSADTLIGGLVAQGYRVGALADGGVVHSSCASSALIALHVEANDEDQGEPDAEDLEEDLNDVLKKNAIKIHSYVIMDEANHTTWGAGNIYSLPERPPSKSKTVFDHLDEGP